MVKTIERKRLKFLDGYTYLNRNMIMESHPPHIHDSLLGYFKQEDLHQYPDMWKTYEVLSQHLGVKKDKLLITRGVEGSIKQVFDTLNLSSKSVGVVSNTFAMYYVYAKAHDVNVIEIQGTEPEYKIEIEDLKKIIPKLKVLFLDNPKSHLPSHFYETELYEIIKYCDDLGVIVFLDEVYVGWELKSYLPNLSKHNNLIIAQSFSKIAFPCIKSGWLVTSEELNKQLSSTRNSYELDYFACKAIEFLIDNQGYINDLKSEVLKVKQEWYDLLRESKLFKVYNSKGYTLRLYNKNESFVKLFYDNLYKQKIVVNIVDNKNLVFSVTTDEKVKHTFFNEILKIDRDMERLETFNNF